MGCKPKPWNMEVQITAEHTRKGRGELAGSMGNTQERRTPTQQHDRRPFERERVIRRALFASDFDPLLYPRTGGFPLPLFFVGHIPTEIGELAVMTVLGLENNDLSGG